MPLCSGEVLGLVNSSSSYIDLLAESLKKEFFNTSTLTKSVAEMLRNSN